MQRGAAQGERDAGPVGAVVGGTIGAVTGTIGGILGVEERPRFREYVVRQRHPSYRYESDLRIGASLPENGVTYERGAERISRAAATATLTSTITPSSWTRARIRSSRSSTNGTSISAKPNSPPHLAAGFLLPNCNQRTMQV